jgi:hypothetical protein
MKSPGKKRVLSVAAGICTALVIAFTQLFYVEISEPFDNKQETGQSASSQKEQQYISLPSSFSLPTSAHVVLNHEFSFIKEVVLDNQHSDEKPVAIQLFAGKLFRTLFHFIISPNAP